MQNLSHRVIDYLASGVAFMLSEDGVGESSGLLLMARHHQSDAVVRDKLIGMAGINNDTPLYIMSQKFGETDLQVTICGGDDSQTASALFTTAQQENLQSIFQLLHGLPTETTLICALVTDSQHPQTISPARIDGAWLRQQMADIVRDADSGVHSAPYKIAETDLMLPQGQAKLMLYQGEAGFRPTAVLMVGAPDKIDAPLVRLHSECFTGDVFASMHCDCGHQLASAIEMIFTAGAGLILYLPQEGRSIGLPAKLHAYQLQRTQQLDTVEANHSLGLAIDNRNFTFASKILHQLDIGKIKLISNNPKKKNMLIQQKIEIAEMVTRPAHLHAHNKAYIATKKHKLNHLID